MRVLELPRYAGSRALGRVAPGIFIPVAENGLMREIGRFTLERAIDALARWHAKPRSTSRFGNCAIHRFSITSSHFCARAASIRGGSNSRLRSLPRSPTWIPPSTCSRVAAISACASRWTILERTIRRSRTCNVFRSIRSRSTSHSSRAVRPTPTTRPSYAVSRPRARARASHRRRRYRNARAAGLAPRSRLRHRARLPACKADGGNRPHPPPHHRLLSQTRARNCRPLPHRLAPRGVSRRRTHDSRGRG